MKHLSLRLSIIAFVGLSAFTQVSADPQIINGKTYTVAKGKSLQVPGIFKESKTRVTPPCPPPLPNLPLDGSVPLANPNALPGAFYPNPLVSNALVAPPQTIGLIFQAGKQGINPGVLGTPPDTFGVKGLTQFVMGDNIGLVSFDDQGNRDGILDSFQATVSNLDGDFTLFEATLDNRIHYDRLANRYVSVNLVSANTGTGYNAINLAISDSGILTKDTQWTVFTIFDIATAPDSNGCPADVSDPVDQGNFFDYPCLGIDANALYISFSIFNQAPAPGAWITNNVLVIQKKSLYNNNGPVVITAFPKVTLDANGNFVGDQVTYRAQDSTLFPLNNFDDPNPAFGYLIGIDPVYFGKLRVYRVLDAGSTSPSIAGPFIIDVMQTFILQTSTTNLGSFFGQPYGTLGLIGGNADYLVDSSHINKKQIYTAQSILMNNQGISSASGDRRGVRWYQLDVTGDPTGNGLGNETVNTVPVLVQAGSLYDTAVTANPLYYLYPAIMSNGQGDISICGSVMGGAQPPSAYYVGKAGTDPKDGILKIGAVPPNVYAVGAPPYTRGLGLGDNGNGQRWGDMSFSSVDPVDNKTIWTIQEICLDGCETQVVAKLLAP